MARARFPSTVPPRPRPRRALVTGATAGIGASFAAHLAGQGCDLVIVARDRERLDDTARRLAEQHGVGVEVLVADLSTTSGIDACRDRLARAPAVDLLINNAGLSTGADFLTADLAGEDAALNVMVRAVLHLTHAASASMATRGGGGIINVSSVAGWIPGSTYSAAKAWVTVFTEGLGETLAGSGVHAMALCPGFVRTEFHERAGMDVSAVPAFLMGDADQVVAQALHDYRRSRVISTPGLTTSAARWGLRVAPPPLVRALARRRPPSQAS